MTDRGRVATQADVVRATRADYPVAAMPSPHDHLNPTRAADLSQAPQLLDRSVLLVTGKGGVGKSTVALALARAAADAGKRVLLLEVEPVSRAAPLFGLETLGPQPVSVAPNLSVARIDAHEALRAFFLQQLRIPALVQLALRNKAVEGFFQAMPAIRSILFLYRLWRLEAEQGQSGDRTWDLIVCDLPTSGFVVGMCAIPKALTQMLPFGPVAAYAEGMQQLLSDGQRTGLMLVTRPEEMPVVETLELHHTLQSRFGLRAAAFVMNGMYPELLDPAELDALSHALETGETGATDDRWLWAARLLGERHRKSRGFLPELRRTGRPVLELPFLFRRELPLDAIDLLARRLAPALRGAA